VWIVDEELDHLGGDVAAEHGLHFAFALLLGEEVFGGDGEQGEERGGGERAGREKPACGERKVGAGHRDQR